MKTLQDKIKNLKCVNYNMYIGSGTLSCDNCLCFEDALEELLGFISQEIQKAVEEGRYNSALRLRQEKSLSGVQNWIQDVIDEYEELEKQK